jgi:hypothetical protein
VGDDDECKQGKTAALIAGPTSSGASAAAVLPLGDNQYEEATLEEYLTVYDRTWGATGVPPRPAVGNHEYRVSATADGYFLLRAGGR